MGRTASSTSAPPLAGVSCTSVSSGLRTTSTPSASGRTMASAAGPSGSAASSRAQPNGASRSRSATGRSSSAPRSCLRLPRPGRRHSRTPPSPPPPQKPRTLRGASRTDTARPRRRPLSPTSRRPRLRRCAPVRLSTSQRTTRSPRTALTCTPTHRRGVARHEAGERDHLGRQGELLQHDRAGAHGRQQARPQRLWARQAPRLDPQATP